MARRIGFLGLLALFAAGCATAEEARKPEWKPAVDAVTRASWRELTADEIISADALYKEQLLNPKLVLYDARGKKDYDNAHIQGALLPLPKWFYNDLRLAKEGIILEPPNADRALEQSMAKVPKETPIVTYCNRDCKASAALVMKLKSLGFTNVRAMEEGLQAWEEKGYPVERSAPEAPQEGVQTLFTP